MDERIFGQLAGLALVLLKVWVWAHWRYLRISGREPRRVDQAVFQLRRFRAVS